MCREPPLCDIVLATEQPILLIRQNMRDLVPTPTHHFHTVQKLT